jgi:hypothetical protein
MFLSLLTLLQLNKTSVNYNSARDEKPGSTGSTYPNKSLKANMKTYVAPASKKKGHIGNLSYSSRPKTTQYLTNGNQSGSTKKNQANSFMTHSMDNSKTPKGIEGKPKTSMHAYERTMDSTGKRSPLTIEDASSSARQNKYSRLPKGQGRPMKPNEFNSVKETDLTDSQVHAPKSEEMKTYLGPFSVSCSTTKDPATVMSDMAKALEMYGIDSQKVGSYFIQCQKHSVNFEMELTRMDNLEFVYIVRMLRTQGDIAKYKNLASHVLSAMKL